MITIKCENCGKDFQTHQCVVNKGYSKFCSRSCYENPQRRFWAKVKRGNQNECWEWQGHINPNGYGSFRDENGKMGTAHRFSYRLHFGEVPKGMYVCHTCDNKRCINPHHLFIGTHMDNVLDCISKDRHTKGSRNGNAKLNEGKVERIRNLSKNTSRKVISILFGISLPQIGKIIRRESWK